jgi:hypothetical protein
MYYRDLRYGCVDFSRVSSRGQAATNFEYRTSTPLGIMVDFLLVGFVTILRLGFDNFLRKKKAQIHRIVSHITAYVVTT